jgi:hypothetical protein
MCHRDLKTDREIRENGRKGTAVTYSELMNKMWPLGGNWRQMSYCPLGALRSG